MGTICTLPAKTTETEILDKSGNSLISNDVFINPNHDSLTLISDNNHTIFSEDSSFGCINGLVFIQDSHYFGSYGFKIWNPATKQCLEIDPPATPTKFGLRDYFSGFGYDSVADDYKCMYIYVHTKGPFYGKIYSCKAGRWSKITPSKFRNPGFEYNNVLDRVTVNGSPFWMITQGEDVNLRMIVMSVDVRKKSFRLLPDLGSSDSTFTGKYTLLNFRDSLAIMVYNSSLFFGGTIDIHVFNEKGDTWSKMCFGPFKFLSRVPTSLVEPRFLQCCRNGDILFSSPETKKLYWVDLENYTIKSLGKRGVSDGHTYSESLVFVDGMKPLYEEIDRFKFSSLRKTMEEKPRGAKMKYRKIKFAMRMRKYQRKRQDD
ncbi:hypothetical protein POM88_048984 [Heracleum sosnowskyi]|uniref:F-box associated beta-propeller type 3 domain-containing protein n=1 Tax=Heracleum sosnowskyi TaxID=360622 RepID=A0AAD8M180_9APIA|nr:hypothetical protein POM88_048984 [Heracleum sosnowskyi]